MTNHSLDHELLPLTIEFEADFRDMFEIRGLPRSGHGEHTPPSHDGRRITFGYHGLDGIDRRCVIAFSEPPARFEPDQAMFMFSLQPRAQFALYIEVGAEPADTPCRERFREASVAAILDARRQRRRGAHVRARGRSLQRLARPVARRPRLPDHQSRHRPLPLRRHPLVLDAVRP